MAVFEKTAKITRKGQLTLPKVVRDALKADIVRIILEEGGQVRIEPVEELAGSLKQYADEPYIPHQTARNQAWKKIVDEKHTRR
jgi:bifunctional DNA-binding transcriptional regulator/antitoxin component of YhaV-PrlF toxin-antitoxin module